MNVLRSFGNTSLTAASIVVHINFCTHLNPSGFKSRLVTDIFSAKDFSELRAAFFNRIEVLEQSSPSLQPEFFSECIIQFWSFFRSQFHSKAYQNHWYFERISAKGFGTFRWEFWVKVSVLDSFLVALQPEFFSGRNSQFWSFFRTDHISEILVRAPKLWQEESYLRLKEGRSR